jgi:hypothetical protein
MRYVSLVLLTTVAILTASYTLPRTAITARFHNDIKELLQLKEEPLIQQLEPLINTCDVYVNDKHICPGQTRAISIENQRCTIDIKNNLHLFDPLLPKSIGSYVKFFINRIGHLFRGWLSFSHTLGQDDIHYIQTTDGNIRLSNILIDLMANIDSLNEHYKVEYFPTKRSMKIIILT